MKKGMWAIFFSVLVTGIFTGFELKTGIDASPSGIFSNVLDSFSRLYPQTSPVVETGKLALVILGIADTVLLVLAILLYRLPGIASSALAFAGGAIAVFSSYSMYGGIMIVVGGLIAMFLDPEGYAEWRNRRN